MEDRYRQLLEQGESPANAIDRCKSEKISRLNKKVRSISKKNKKYRIRQIVNRDGL